MGVGFTSVTHPSFTYRAGERQLVMRSCYYRLIREESEMTEKGR